MLSHTEENYIKAIYKAYEKTNELVNTNTIAENLQTTPASVTDMIKKLAFKKMIIYERYKGTKLTHEGTQLATELIRRHRLWETFLVEKLRFSWEEVHQLAEDLEHIKSPKLVDRLDEYLGYPKYDPHGDPIPNADGKFTLREQINLLQFQKGNRGHLIGVKNKDQAFLQHLNELGIGIGVEIELLDKNLYDKSIQIAINHSNKAHMTDKVANKLIMKKII